MKTNKKRGSNGWNKPLRCLSCLQPKGELCSTCLAARNHHTIERSLDNWDMIPSMSQSSIVIIDRGLKRRRVGDNNVASISKLPTFMPSSSAAAAAASTTAAAVKGDTTPNTTPQKISEECSSSMNAAKEGTKTASKESTSDYTPDNNAVKGGDKIQDASHHAKTISKESTSCASKVKKSKDTKQTKPQTNKPKDLKPNLLGATIRIKKGKFTGIKANIIEVQKIRRVILDSVAGHVFDITEILLTKCFHNCKHIVALFGRLNAAEQFFNAQQQMLQHGKRLEERYTYDEMCKIYQGATVRVLNSKEIKGDDKKKKEREHVGTVGNVVRAIVGDWYITNHPTIEKAFQESQFDVMRYAKDVGVEEGVKETMESDDEVQVIESVDNAKGTTTAHDSTKLANNSKMKDSTAPQADQAPKGKQDISNTKSNKVSIGRNSDTGLSLIGATIQIKKGKYAGLMGVITEKQIMHRLLLDSIPAPVNPPNVQVVHYNPNNSAMNNAGEEEEHQKYLGATVRVLRPEKFAGMEGKVIELVQSDWYIVDNPDLPTAFSRKGFNVVSYAPDGNVKENVFLDTESNGTKGGEVARNEVVKVSDLSQDKPDEGGKAASLERICPDIVKPTNKSDDATVEHTDKKTTSSKQMASTVGEGKNQVYCLDCSTDNTSQNVQQQMHDEKQKENISDNSNTQSIGDGVEAAKADSDQPPSTDGNTRNENEITIVEETSTDENLTRPNPDRLPSTDVSNQSDDSAKESLANEAKTESTKYEIDNTECVVELPSGESVELAARLSAFDSFLFLANNNEIDSSHLENSTTSGSTESAAKTTVPCEPQKTQQQESQVDSCTSTSSHHDKALAEVLQQLLEHKQKERQWPAVKVLPGMDVLIEENDQPSKIIPLEQKIVRTVPGSMKERNDMVKRLGAFDDFMFLIEDTPTSNLR